MSTINLCDYNLEEVYERAQLIADAPSAVYFRTDESGNEESVAITRDCSMIRKVTYANNPDWVEVSTYDKYGWLQNIKHVPKNPDLSGWIDKQVLLSFIASHFEDMKKEDVSENGYESQLRKQHDLEMLCALFNAVAENELEPTHEVNLNSFIEENL